MSVSRPICLFFLIKQKQNVKATWPSKHGDFRSRCHRRQQDSSSKRPPGVASRRPTSPSRLRQQAPTTAELPAGFGKAPGGGVTCPKSGLKASLPAGSPRHEGNAVPGNQFASFFAFFFVLLLLIFFSFCAILTSRPPTSNPSVSAADALRSLLPVGGGRKPAADFAFFRPGSKRTRGQRGGA